MIRMNPTRPKLMQKFVHLPFGERQCETCHQPAKDGKVVLLRRAPRNFALLAMPTRKSRLTAPKFNTLERWATAPIAIAHMPASLPVWRSLIQ